MISLCLRPRSLRVIDATTYDLITEVVGERNIVHMAVNPSDTHLSLIEESRKAYMMDIPVESLCRMYEIGRVKSLEDEDDDEEEDEEEDEDAADAAMDFIDRLAEAEARANGDDDDDGVGDDDDDDDDGLGDDDDELGELDDEDLALLAEADDDDDAEAMDFDDDDDDDADYADLLGFH